MHPSRRRKKRPNYGVRTVEVIRGPNGFGFTISGQQPCILSCIVANSPADQAGLRAGDFLISVNGLSVSKMTHDSVVALIGNCVGGIRMTIAENYYSDSSDEDLDCRAVNRKPKSHKARSLRQCKDDVAGPIEYKVLVGYLGTIEMPKQLPPNSRLQTVCSCIRKLRQEKRTPTAVLMTVLPTCLTLKNAANHILAIYPTNRVIYISSSIDREARYFGLVTSATCDTRTSSSETIDVSNSCHVFVTDPKIAEHSIHGSKAESFNISCTPDLTSNSCLEFPRNSLHIVSLVQSMYKLSSEKKQDEIELLANSPQPSASSNSDSGIGFRDDCGNVSDRILLVEFPTHRSLPTNNELNNARVNNLSATKEEFKQNNLNNIRACESLSIKNHLEPDTSKRINVDRLNCRAMPDLTNLRRNLSPVSISSSDDNTLGDRLEEKDDVSMRSVKSLEDAVFKAPKAVKKDRRLVKLVSCDDLDRYKEEVMSYKLSPKVFGMVKPNYSCEELNNLDSEEKGFGAFKGLNWEERGSRGHRSEPDVRLKDVECEQNAAVKTSSPEGALAWSSSFEKLLEDPLGLHAFAEFLKKEFSAENIYFWTACERFKALPPGSERKAEAERIFQQHLALGAPDSVNVDSQGRHCAEQALLDPDCAAFDQAQKQVFNLMKFDSYPRFLKSDIYKQFLGGVGGKVKVDLDPGLTIQAAPKLKKSLSNAEDRRRKSLLPWHRKNRSRSKSKDEGRREQEEVYSSQSSVGSLDLDKKEEGLRKMCRVRLGDDSTSVVQIREGETVQMMVKRLLEKKRIEYSAFEVFVKGSKALDAGEEAVKLTGCEVRVEQRVVFKLDLPNKKIISVKSKYTKIIVDVLRPILHKYDYSLEEVVVLNGGGGLVDLTEQVTAIDNARLNIQLREKTETEKPSNLAPPNGKKLDEITNKVFEEILHNKSESAPGFKSGKSEKGSVKSEDWGSEHSSGIFGKFLRRDSGVHPKKKIALKNKPDETETKKPLIAKWKSGPNKLNIACSESDELVEGLTRAQRSRLEDQRGTEIKFPLPDFLKDKENELARNEKGRFDSKSVRNYENSVLINAKEALVPAFDKVTSKSLDEGLKVKRSEPPPLPPKPKIVPIKPPNWGQNGFYKHKDISTERSNLYLEQSSSSFV